MIILEKWLPGFRDRRGSGVETRSSYSKEELTSRLFDIKRRGWITLEKHREDRDGGLGNTLEDLLGIPENNIPLADYGSFELKTHRNTSNSLISLFRFEPRPGKIIPRLLKNYGWPLEKYGPREKSLRIDIDAAKFCERGFIAKILPELQRVELHFDRSQVPKKEPYIEWLKNVERNVGLGDLNPIPYWTFDDLEKKIRTKIKNMVFVSVDTSKQGGKQTMRIASATLLRGATLDNLLNCIHDGCLQIEFSARTHHNHGTAFRIWPRFWPNLYKSVEKIIPN